VKNNFLSKSDLNLDAAERLKNNPNNHYSSSIHCSYYSCYQRLLDILYRILGYSEASFKQEFNDFKARQPIGQPIGPHDYMIQFFWDHLSTKSHEDAKDFRNNILLLKKLRTDSDYKDLWIEKDVSDRALVLATTIHKNLKKHF
jgi:hypothetical protein